jgi:uncharacterized membrane protein
MDPSVDPDPVDRPVIEGRSEMDLRLPGIILTVTGILAIVVSLTRGPNLNIPRRTGVIAGIVMLVIGVLLLIYATAVPQ